MLHGKSDRRLLLMSSPALIKIFVFSYLPMVGIVIAFQDYKPRTGFLSEFVGFDNFRYLIASSNFYRILFNTLFLNILFISTGLIVAVVLGLFLFEVTNKRFLKISQTTFFFPYFISWALAGMILLSMLDSAGFVTALIEKMTGETVAFYMESKYWPLILTLVNAWKMGGVSGIIYYTTLMNADRSVYEAADIDGANRWQKMRYISVPYLKTMIFVLTIMSFANIIHCDFNMIFFTTRNSGPLFPTTDVIDTYVFRALSQDGDFAIAAAIGLFQSVVGLVFSVAANRISKRFEPQSALF
jgi:putative aldouronate transport system permease protein